MLNLGAYASFDGRLVFDINDFDETIRGPFEWDLKRMATSLLLAGRTAGIGHLIHESAVARFVSSYRKSIHKFATMPMLRLARYQIHRLEERSPIRTILKSAERSTPIRLLKRLTENNHRQRRFKSQVDKLVRALTDYEDSLQPERKHFLGRYRLIDAAFKVVGMRCQAGRYDRHSATEECERRCSHSLLSDRTELRYVTYFRLVQKFHGGRRVGPRIEVTMGTPGNLLACLHAFAAFRMICEVIRLVLSHRGGKGALSRTDRWRTPRVSVVRDESGAYYIFQLTCRQV